MRFAILMTAFLFSSLQACTKPAVSIPSAQIKQQIKETVMAAGDLKGLYLNAGKGSPIAIIVPGSGPTDLNGNAGTGMQTNTYKYLAQQLGTNGISTVRVDKRGMYSSAAAGDPNAVTVQMYTQDYRQWIDIIKEKTQSDCVYLIGHSEGGLMVSSAAIGRTDVCGLILVAAMGRPLGKFMREQLKTNPANRPILKQAFKAISKLEDGKTVNTRNFHPALKSLFHENIQGFWISQMGVDPAKIAAKANQKTLIIQGKNDIQVFAKDAQLLHEATNGKLVFLDKVSHILKIAPSSRHGNIATYNDPDLPIAEDVINSITAFIEP